MLSDLGRHETKIAQKYLQQLCKHFAHKVEVELNDTQGKVALGMGPATLTATENELTAKVTAHDDEGLAHARQIIDSHLKRFAFREDFEKMIWSSEAT